MDWPTIGAIFGIVSGLTVASTAYLRLFVSNEVRQMKEEILRAISEKYFTKEGATYMADRISHLERKRQV